MFGLGPMELMIVGIIAVLLFGNRLPEVARSMGKSLNEFKRGMRSVEDEFRAESRSSTTAANRVAYQPEATGDDPSFPKFVPPTAEPSAEAGGKEQPQS